MCVAIELETGLEEMNTTQRRAAQDEKNGPSHAPDA